MRKTLQYVVSISACVDKEGFQTMFRLIIGFLFAVLYCIVSIPILFVEWIIKHFNPDAATKSMFRIVQWAFRVVWKISGAKVTVIGRDNIPDDEAVLFVANHQSFFDVILGYPQMKGRTGYVAKKEFEKVPLLSTNMKFLYCLFLDREDLRQGMETIRQEIAYIEEGISIFVFPEGTRNKSGDETNIAPFHRGSFKPAQRTGCKIVPVSFNNTEAVFERNFPHVKPQKVIIEFGKPVTYSDLSKDDQRHIDVYFHDMIQNMVKKNQALEH